jgi:hypothetical protein
VFYQKSQNNPEQFPMPDSNVDLVVATYKLKLFAFFVTNPSGWLVVIVDSLRIKKYTSSVEILNSYLLVVVK